MKIWYWQGVSKYNFHTPLVSNAETLKTLIYNKLQRFPGIIRIIIIKRMNFFLISASVIGGVNQGKIYKVRKWRQTILGG